MHRAVAGTAASEVSAAPVLRYLARMRMRYRYNHAQELRKYVATRKHALQQSWTWLVLSLDVPHQPKGFFGAKGVLRSFQSINICFQMAYNNK